MRAEALEAPQVVTRLMASDAGLYAALAADLLRHPPRSVVTVARGSSDHAANFLAYLVMSRLGQLVTSLPMSLITLHDAPLRCEGGLALALSQSGRSPDLGLAIEHLRRSGARTVAVVNDTASPLAGAAQWVLPLHAGAETSVAATKSFIAQLAVAARLLACWQGDAALDAALRALPPALERAAGLDWSAALEALVSASRLYVIGRGSGLAVASEAALKLKEVCGLQAEAFSGAELEHGPMALVGVGYPLLVLAPRGPAQAGLLELSRRLRGQGARVLLAAPSEVAEAELPLEVAEDETLDPMLAVQSFYSMVEALARARGLDPDAPRHLSKVTLTR